MTSNGHEEEMLGAGECASVGVGTGMLTGLWEPPEPGKYSRPQKAQDSQGSWTVLKA